MALINRVVRILFYKSCQLLNRGNNNLRFGAFKLAFGDKEASGIVLMHPYKDYYEGYTDSDGEYHQGYRDMITELLAKFPLSEPSIIGEQNQKNFIALFGAILRMRNLLTSFDDFIGQDLLSERDLQDYLGRYQDLRDEWKKQREEGTKEDISDDVVFEIELVKQIEINIDYILKSSCLTAARSVFLG